MLWGEFDAATQAHGLATVGGIVTHTGIAGLTLGGGIGWLMRKHGATVDNLLSATVVTAEGERVTASETEYPDLFWGLRGGGGNFGVVTSFEYRLHEVGTVLAGPIYHALEDAPEVLRHYRDVVADAPDELTTILNLRHAPPLAYPAAGAARPARVHRRRAGSTGGEVDELRRFGRPLFDGVAPRPYAEVQRLFDPAVPHGWHYLLEIVGGAAAHGLDDRHARRAGRPDHLAALVHHRLPTRRRRVSWPGHRVPAASRGARREHQRGLARRRATPNRISGGRARRSMR